MFEILRIEYKSQWFDMNELKHQISFKMLRIPVTEMSRHISKYIYC